MDKNLIARLSKALETLTADDAPEGTMTPDQFVAYATDQVEKAAKDKDPAVRKARLSHLKDQVAAVAKNFEGEVPAAIPVQTFKDPGQKTPTTEDLGNPAPQNQSENVANFGSNDPGPAKAGVGSPPPGGDMPGATAGTGAPGYPESFAKAMAALTKAIDGLGAPAPATGTTPAAPAPAPAPGATPPAQGAPAPGTETTVEKSIGVIWPSDMNSPIGRGLAEDEADLPWGFDKGSAPAKRAETRKNAQR